MEITLDKRQKETKKPLWQRLSLWQKFWEMLSIRMWGSLPSTVQRKISEVYTRIYEKRPRGRHLLFV